VKKNDIASLVLIAVIAGVIAYFAANAVVGQPKNNPVQVEKITPIQSSFPTPDPRVFNDKAIDPTVEIGGNNPQTNAPFADN
jgi:hypothetical protein